MEPFLVCLPIVLYRNLKEADPVAGASQTFNHRPDAGKQQIIWAEGLN